MSEQMSAGELLNRLRGSVTRTTIHPYLTQSEAASLILADRKATVERCRRAVMRQFEEVIYDGISGDYVLDGQWYSANWGCDTLEHICTALDAVLEDR